LLPIVYEGDSPFQAAWAFEYASRVKADVANWSWSFSYTVEDLEATTPSLVPAIRDNAAVVVMAAGNGAGDNPCSEGDGLLQSLPDVTVVGASNHRDWGIRVAKGSCLSVIAPGGTGGFLGIFPPWGSSWKTGIVTTDVPGAGGYNPGGSGTEDYSDGDFTRRFSGTSAAAPIVAGVVGLMLQVDPTLDAATVKTYLQNSADKVDRWFAGYDASGHSDTHGYGRVNACSAVRMAAGDGSPGDCPRDATPYWLLILLIIVLLLLPGIGFVVSVVLLGWCHVLTWITGAVLVGEIAFLVAWLLTKKIKSWFWWMALGVAVLVFVIFWILC